MMLRTPTTHHLPEQPAQPVLDMDMYELITVTARLKDVLIQETEYLKTMQVRELGKLQDEKQKLTKLLESYQQMLAARPELIQALDESSREELGELTEAFSRAVSENLQRTAVARAVNQRVVSAIMEVVTEQHHAGTYNRYGSSAAPTDMSISFNLNQKA